MFGSRWKRSLLRKEQRIGAERKQRRQKKLRDPQERGGGERFPGTAKETGGLEGENPPTEKEGNGP